MAARERLALATDVEVVRPVIDLALNAMSIPHCRRELRVTRVFPSGNGLCIQYGIELFDSGRRSRVLLCGLLAQDGEIPEWANHGAVFTMPGAGLVLPAFPYDPALRALETFVTSRDAVIEWLGRCGIRAKADFPCETEVMAYRLKRRCVLRHTLQLADGVHRIVSKVMRRNRVTGVVDVWRALADGPDRGGLRLPRVLAVDVERGLLGMEFVEGRSLHDSVGEREFVAACERSARLLETLHRHDGRCLSEYGAVDELAMLERFRALVEAFHLEDADAITARVDRLRSHVPSADHRRTAIHRDFYDKQVVLSPDGATMLDWDGVSLGDPAMDVGNFVAHLNLRALQHASSIDLIEAGARRFMAATDEDGGRVEWWRAASLTRLAVLYRWRPRWKHLFDPLLSEADMAMKLGGMK